MKYRKCEICGATIPARNNRKYCAKCVKEGERLREKIRLENERASRPPKHRLEDSPIYLRSLKNRTTYGEEQAKETKMLYARVRV